MYTEFGNSNFSPRVIKENNVNPELSSLRLQIAQTYYNVGYRVFDLHDAFKVFEVLLIDNINIRDVHDQFTQTGDRLTNLDIKGIELKSSKIENVLDVDLLKERSAEWGAEYYQKWKSESAYAIHLYNGMIPYKINFLGRVIKEYVKGNAVLHDKIAYVNANSKNIEEDLFSVTKYNSLKEADLLNLLRYKNEGEEQVGGHTIIEKVIETVVVEEKISDDQEFFDNPSIDDLIDLKSNKRKGKLKVDIDLSDLPDELLEQLVKIADRSRVIVERTSSKSIDKR